jgi:RING finger protein 113A
MAESVDSADAPAEAAPVAFKKPKRPQNQRKRPADAAAVAAAASSSDAAAADASEGSSVVRTVKQAKPNPMVQGTASAAAVAAAAAKSQARQQEMVHGSDRRISNFDSKVFASSEQETERGADAQAQYEAAQKMWDDGGDIAPDGSRIYRGMKAYKPYTGKSESFDNQVNSGAGPARAPVHYRAVSRFDYQPDVCKDYKDTGFCGYGDACKFLHDRGDYKTGWQLEKDCTPRTCGSASRGLPGRPRGCGHGIVS